MPITPSFVKDGVIITVETTTTEVSAHYIVLEIEVNGAETYTIKHPVINNFATFDVAEIINNEVSEAFDLEASYISAGSISTSWRVRASEIYNYDSTYKNTTSYSASHSYSGSGQNYNSNYFLTNLKPRRINRNEYTLLFFNLPEILLTPNREVVIMFNDESTTTISETVEILTKSVQILVPPSVIPDDATMMTVQITDYSELHLIYIDDINIIEKDIFIYKNQFGAYDILTFLAHSETKHLFNFETFQTTNSIKKYNSTYTEEKIKATYILSSQFQDEASISDLLKEFFLSEEVYLMADDLSYQSVIILDSDRIVENTQEQDYKLSITYQKVQKNA